MTLALASRHTALTPPWVRDYLWCRARAVPSLDLRFADNKSLVDATTGAQLVTFTRASSGTFVGSDGLIKSATTNEPRFDHNPTTGESLGLLVEEARTNLVRNNTMVGAVAGSPGTPPTNGWVIVNNATYTSSILGTGTENGINYIDIQYVVAAGAAAATLFYCDTPAASALTTYTGSYYFKLISGTIPQVRFIWQDGISTYNKTFFTLTATLTRYTDTLTTAILANLARFAVGIDAAPSGATFVIRVGLPQIEQGAFATSVIPTTSATATRAADVASITGSNFSSWYNQTEGTVFADYKVASSSGNLIGSSDGTNNNRIFLGIASGPLARLLVTTSGSAVANIGVAYALNSAAKTAGVYSANYFQSATAGVLGTEDVLGGVPTVDRLSIGTNTTQSDFFANGTIKRLTYWPTRLATLQAITQP